MEQGLITWPERVANLSTVLGRTPTEEELLEAAFIHKMTPDEKEAQLRDLPQSSLPITFVDLTS